MNRFHKGDRVAHTFSRRVGTVVSERLKKTTRLIAGDLYLVQWDHEAEPRVWSDETLVAGKPKGKK